jgi:hypothetical protein
VHILLDPPALAHRAVSVHQGAVEQRGVVDGAAVA